MATQLDFRQRIRLMTAGAVALLSAWPPCPSSGAQAGDAKIDFYGKKVSLLKMFGQTRWRECTPGRVDGTKIYHAAGVLVDRGLSPNAIYVADTGNSRILGFRSMASPKADLIFGQPDEFSSAPNGDCNIGRFAPPTRTSMCLMDIPGNTNLAEQSTRLNFDVDREGNLYVPDIYNNRVLIFLAPFSPDRTGGKGDTIPDAVIGQDDYSSNGINRGRGPNGRDARSIYISIGGFDFVSSRGLSVDPGGNLWVADTFNHRVLRFPRGSTTADLVLGQPNFTDGEPNRDLGAAPWNRMCAPTLARVDPGTGELYVIDEYPGGFPARILVFVPPFTNGMAAAREATPRQRLEGEFAEGYQFTHATGLVFNACKLDAWIDERKRTDRYRDGVFWVHDETRTLLVDGHGNILLALGAFDLISRGCSNRIYDESGVSYLEPFNVRRAGGMIGLDSQCNIYLADDAMHRIARFALPYRLRRTRRGLALPKSNGGLFPGTRPNTVGPAHMHADRVGVFVHGDQLIVRDHQRYLVWNNYLRRGDGSPADVFVGQRNGWSLDRSNPIRGRSMHALDHKGQLWAVEEAGRLMAFPLPMKAGTRPLRDQIPLYWADQPSQEVQYRCHAAMTIEPRTGRLWVFDRSHYRLLRVRIPNDLNRKLLVDAVLGQANKQDGEINRGQMRPSADSLGNVNDVRFDRLGNLFVVDNTYEVKENGRILMFRVEDLSSVGTMFPPIRASKVFVAQRFDQAFDERSFASEEQPKSPVCVAFNSRNEMVVGNDGYYHDPRTRNINQLYLYRRPLEDSMPDAAIELPLGAPGEIIFDASDNLIVQDHTYNKVWVINFDRDPVWLRMLR